MAKLIGAMVVTFMLAVASHVEATCAWVLSVSTKTDFLPVGDSTRESSV